MVRVQVLMQKEDREKFRRMARQNGMSLSAWLRNAGLESVDRQLQQTQLDSVEALADFFGRCDAREQGIEPDWLEHLEVIGRSKSAGESGT